MNEDKGYQQLMALDQAVLAAVLEKSGKITVERTVIRRHRHCVHAIFHVDLHGDDVAVAHVCDVHQMRRFGKPHRTGA